MNRAFRLERHDVVSGRLAALSDQQLMAMLGEATPGAVGIGGATATVDVDGVRVFVKQVPLTDLERQPEHVGSTANLFDLPMYYHYGLGSAGFGVWREVAVHTMTTRWVLADEFAGFPLVYHWRVLPRSPVTPDPEDNERIVARWGGSTAVRRRLTAIDQASASVALFMEHIPYSVHSWLTEQTAVGGQTAAVAYQMVEREINAGIAFMGSRGLAHFDAHFLNLLTDGDRVYFADFGLAMSDTFDLEPAERSFLREHAGYDRGHSATHFTHWLISNLAGVPWGEADDHLRAHAGGLDLPEIAAGIVGRNRDVAVTMGRFYRDLRTVGLETPFPAEELATMERRADGS
ncbi:MAG: protein kinase family protein [Hamadaea sp.]|uniref:serine/threonine protein phosphatase n=1 Tax=Hamadaea sp. TaxID=2024425 RepID=UPI0017A0F7C2|nr:serine/threonine protein phosphatase [Hamadaea sp.]NUT20640.1 protein kinase family protein [Hamadaea sp.]